MKMLHVCTLTLTFFVSKICENHFPAVSIGIFVSCDSLNKVSKPIFFVSISIAGRTP
jgi:hypothetical protein